MDRPASPDQPRPASTQDLLDLKTVLEARLAGKDHELLVAQLDAVKLHRSLRQLQGLVEDKDRRIADLETKLKERDQADG